MDDNMLYETPITSSRDAVSFALRTGIIDPDHKHAAILLDKDGRPRRLSEADADPLGTKGFIYLMRRTGDPAPEEHEVWLCDALRKAAAGTRTKFVDFIIICGGSHYSFAAEKVVGPGV